MDKELKAKIEAALKAIGLDDVDAVIEIEDGQTLVRVTAVKAVRS